MKRSIIDVGSNSVRLMTSDGEKTVITTALGEGLVRSGMLGEGPMARTVEAIVDLKNKAISLGESVEAFATEAVRSASNGAEFVKRVEALGVPVRVLSGEDEALVGYLGATDGKGGAVIDVGGASTEIVFGEGESVRFSTSLKIGIVRARDMFSTDYEALGTYVEKLIKEARVQEKAEELIALGGTATSLAAIDSGRSYSRKAVHMRRLSVDRVAELQRTLSAMTREERLGLAGLHPSRVDTVAGGAKIIEAVMLALGASTMVVSENDNLEGYSKLFKLNDQRFA